MSNAVKFTEKGTISLELTFIEKKDDYHATIRFAVSDTGIGILEKNKHKIFQAFSQEDSSTTRKYGGTGLGLTISNQLLGIMNSSLQLESTIELGSTFYFDLDLKTTDKTLENSINPEITFEKTTPSTTLKNTNKISIMIVEDNKINMLLLTTIIKNLILNPTIYELVNGKEAIEKFEILQPDLIFMDIQMPEMNGYQATAKIRSLSSGKNIPIIAITAGTEKEEKEKCLAAGMNDYISKPIIKGTIEEIISKWTQ